MSAKSSEVQGKLRCLRNVRVWQSSHPAPFLLSSQSWTRPYLAFRFGSRASEQRPKRLSWRGNDVIGPRKMMDPNNRLLGLWVLYHTLKPKKAPQRFGFNKKEDEQNRPSQTSWGLGTFWKLKLQLIGPWSAASSWRSDKAITPVRRFSLGPSGERKLENQKPASGISGMPGMLFLHRNTHSMSFCMLADRSRTSETLPGSMLPKSKTLP